MKYESISFITIKTQKIHEAHEEAIDDVIHI